MNNVKCPNCGKVEVILYGAASTGICSQCKCHYTTKIMPANANSKKVITIGEESS